MSRGIAGGGGGGGGGGGQVTKIANTRNHCRVCSFSQNVTTI